MENLKSWMSALNPKPLDYPKLKGIKEDGKKIRKDFYKTGESLNRAVMKTMRGRGIA